MREKLFYRPEDGWVGDFIPYCENDTFHLFHLKTIQPDVPFEDVGWHCVRTDDFVHFSPSDDLDIHGGTGSVVKQGDLYHLFYCDNDDPAAQYVCHAVSTDMKNWKKLPEYRFEADPAFYERANFRDPHVFWHEGAGEYRMLLATRTVDGPTNRRGCTGQYASHDLYQWRPLPPLYAPGIDVGAHECPDIFRMGDWWYLTYSTYTDFYATIYRMSRSPDGPWFIPVNEMLDGRAFYAGKTAERDGKRYLFGWDPSREGKFYRGWDPTDYQGKDYNVFDWAGNLVVHELIQREDGTLYCGCPQFLDEAFGPADPVKPVEVCGEWKRHTGIETSGNAFSAVSLCGEMPACGCLDFTVRFTDDMRRCGVALHCDSHFDQAYYFTFDRQYNHVAFSTALMQTDDGWRKFYPMAELLRPLQLNAGKDYHVRVIHDGSVVVLYVDGMTAFSARMFDKTDGGIGLFSLGAGTCFSNICYRSLRA